MDNSQPIEYLAVSAPGRICLLGEHQDYLGLPVIPCAINLRITITGECRDDHRFSIRLPDINSSDEFLFDGEIQYVLERDYLRSVVNVLKREDVVFTHGYDCVVRGEIPINSGTSSSSALCVAWVKFLLCIANDGRKDSPEEIGRIAYLAEVEEFGEPGGMMDQYSSALGSVICVDFEPEFRITRLQEEFGAFVLGDSLQEKDTKRTLSRIKTGTFSAVEKIRDMVEDFNLNTSSLDEISPLLSSLPDNERLLLEGAMKTRDIVKRARELFASGEMDDATLGNSLNDQQNVLRDNLRISTPKLDKMIEAAIEAGALGGKINGSGEGGCMFAYTPSNAEAVAEAIEKAGGKAFIIEIDDGVREAN